MKLLRGPITALRHPEILTYFRVRSGFGSPYLWSLSAIPLERTDLSLCVLLVKTPVRRY